MRRARPAIGLLLVAAALSPAPGTLERSVSRMRDGFHGAREDSLTARRRAFGRYAEGIERIKASIPPGGEYVLVGENEHGALYFIQYDLAPRRAFNPPYPTIEALRAAGASANRARWVVVGHSESEAPELLPANDVFVDGIR